MPDDARGWTPVEHACRFCGGRIMERNREYRCFNCGAGTVGGAVRDICGCGLSAGRGLFPFTCAPNPAPSPQSPAAIVIIRAERAVNAISRKP